MNLEITPKIVDDPRQLALGIRRQRRFQWGSAVALGGLGACAAATAAGMPLGTFSLPGPGIMPLIAGVLLLLTAIGLFVNVWYQSVAESADVQKHSGRPAAVIAVCAIGAGLALEYVGYLITSATIVFVLVRLMTPLKTWKIILIALGTTYLLGLLAQRLLGIPLPDLDFRFS